MKLTSLILALLLTAGEAAAQQPQAVTVGQTAVTPRRIEAALQKTVHLIFPAGITSVDRGSADILVQKTSGVENVLKLKAAVTGFKETNLTVITADGRYYSFAVNYHPDPPVLTCQVQPLANAIAPTGGARRLPEPAAIFSDAEKNAATLKALIGQASITRRNMNISDAAYGMETAVRGLYTAKDLFFYKLVVNNHSAVSYDVEAIRFYVQDKKRVKRTATQQVSLQPLEIIGNSQRIEADREELLIAVLPKLTIAGDKELVIELNERNGGRQLVCRINNKQLLNAMPIKATTAVSHLAGK